jgi:tetratricopeptide (TPR) repeat protein
MSVSLNCLAHVLLRQGDLATAGRLAEESLVLQRQIGEHFQLAYCLDVVGQLATAEGHYEEARAALRESLHLRQDLGDRAGMADTLESIAALAATETQSERAVQLAGAAAGIREQVGAPPSPMRRSMVDHWLVPVRQALDAETATRAWEAGRDMAQSRRRTWRSPPRKRQRTALGGARGLRQQRSGPCPPEAAL